MGLKPSKIHWIYTKVVVPLKLVKVQKLVSLLIKEVFKGISTAALVLLLVLHQLHLVVEKI